MTRPFLPPRKRDHAEIFARKLFAKERQIEFAGLRILQMRTGDVNLAFAQPGERQLARGGGGDDLHAADLFHHSRKQTGGRIAAGQHEAFLRRFFLREHDQIGAAVGASGPLDDAIGFRHIVRRSADRNADPARSDLADPHRLALRRNGGAQHFGGERLGRFLRSLLQRKQFVDRHLQLAREVQRNFGIGNVRPGFDRVDRLAADAHAAGQIGGAHASALSNLRQPVLDACLHDAFTPARERLRASCIHDYLTL